ncbi:deoxyguanosinetriphosphate triphosphohydrolase [Aestuariispira ectoiniformans]|uniref:deoxyguanosinetriphosphate triphosphohydrolase n=1 Tax=Aestuariispira ectoiniformans TaxID=2775080 RepID=UPI00223B7833|nr:deoxyguanosinetriphosphate triphosphohydrolase [Aestuariispira ectoiniformans]
MNWEKLLNSSRLNDDKPRDDRDPRSPFQQDIDRIVFSSAFRRLAHKTQVHPLTENDHTHTRLTHSIEVSSVGRSLGTLVGSRLRETDTQFRATGITADEVGYIVQAACLAHDIGNPPFGHSGEKAIASWFSEKRKGGWAPFDDLSPIECADLEKFEGNAVGFRILSQLENNRFRGGLRLTYAVLSTFTKYPSGADASKDGYIGTKKNGFFQSEKAVFETVATATGLLCHDQGDTWKRHPFTFLVEAADDICNLIIDLEDAYYMGALPYGDVAKIMSGLSQIDNLREDKSEKERIGFLRSQAIGKSVDLAADYFMAHLADYLAGKKTNPIVQDIETADAFDRAARKCLEVFRMESITQKELAGYSVLHGLLDEFCAAIEDLRHKGWDRKATSHKSQHLLRLIGDDFPGDPSSLRTYDALMIVTDYLSSMTDRYALGLYQRLRGIAV